MPTYKNNFFIKKTLHKKLIIGSIILALLGITYYLYQLSRPEQVLTTSDGVSLTPATKEEKQDSEQHKQDIIKQDAQNSDQPPVSTQKNVAITIVDASQYGDSIEVRSFVSGVIEDGGKCTVTFVQDMLSFTQESTGTQDATTTSCGKVAVPRSNFQKAGTWKVMVNYTSGKAYGTSTEKTLEVKL